MKDKEYYAGGKTARLLGLFMAAALVGVSGCGAPETVRYEHIHIDRDNDGYCDEDGAVMSENRRGGPVVLPGGYYGGTAGKTAVSGPAAPAGTAPAISSGTAPKGGIGSGATGGGG